MGFKFRKSVKMGPVRVNFSKSGVGYSVGGKGFRVTKKPGGGTRTTASIPGTGISYSSDSKSKKKKASTTTKKVTTKEISAKANTTHSNESASTSSSGGCLKGILYFTMFCVVIGMIKEYWKILLILALVSAAVYIGYKVYRKKNPSHSQNASSEIADTAESIPAVIKDTSTSAPLEASVHVPESNALQAVALPKELTSQQKFELRCAERAKQFDAELDAIPVIDIALSDPAPRHLLKDLPEYSFSNITRKTRLDSIFPLVFLDVETTGFAPSKCEIIEVSAIRFETGMIPVAAFSTLCKPKKPIPEDASTVNHITDEMIADAPTFAQVAPALTEFIKGCHIAGHNLDFDLRFIFAHGADLPEKVRFYDTLDLAHLTIPDSSVYNYKLDTVCHYYGIWRNNAHRSLSDCYATSRLFIHLVRDKTSRQLDANAEILSEANAE